MKDQNLRVRILLTVMVLLGALYRYWPIANPLGPCTLGYESLAIACSVAQKGTFSDPFLVLKTGPTAHVAPLLPMLLSIPVRWLGDSPAALDVIQWTETIAFGLQVSLWPWVAEWMGLGFATGLVGATAWIFVGYDLLPMWEAPFVSILVPLLAVCMYRILKREVTMGFVTLTAALWGFTFLMNPVPLLVFGALLAWIIFFRPMPALQKLALTVIPFVVISPWVVRNYLVFHHTILIRDNLGTELWISNNPCATFWFRHNQATNCYHHPNEEMAEAVKVRSMGEYAYNQADQQQAISWIKKNPARFATLTEERFLAFWVLISSRNYFIGQQHIPLGLFIVWAMTPLSLGGLWLLWKRDRVAAWVCLAWLTVFPLIYYVVQFTPRYRYPILWASFLPAAYLVVEGWQIVWRRMQASEVEPMVRNIAGILAREW